MEDTDSPDSGHREMSSDSLCLQQAEFPFWTMSQDERLQYSVGFGSPVRYKQTSYEMTAVVNSNPFANSREDICDEDILDFSNLGTATKELDTDQKCCVVGQTTKIQPPPEFRNFDSFRNSQISDDSSNSSNSETDSLKDGIVNFTDSDYYSHTGSSFLNHSLADSAAQSINNRHVKQSTGLLKPKLEYHFNNFTDDQTIMHKYFEHISCPMRRASFSDEDNTESYEECLVPSPPPPPTELEEAFED